VHDLVLKSKTLQKNPKGKPLLASLKEEVEGDLMTLAILKLWEKLTSRELAVEIESSIQLAIIDQLRSGGFK
jgi:hypothetical protein